jgi:hypothetical protein
MKEDAAQPGRRAKDVNRSYKFRLRPTRNQEAALGACLEDTRQLYNAAVEERREAWRMGRRKVTFYSQSAQLKEIRADDPERYGRWSFNCERSVIRRLDRAFQGFFRRIKAEEKPGHSDTGIRDTMTRAIAVVWSASYKRRRTWCAPTPGGPSEQSCAPGTSRPNATVAASSNDSGVYLLNADTGVRDRAMNMETERVWAETFSPDGGACRPGRRHRVPLRRAG